MTTKFIGLKEFRQNISTYAKSVKKAKYRIIILKKNIPVFEVKPIDEKEFALKKLAEEIKEAREQVKRGEVYTEEEVRKMLGL